MSAGVPETTGTELVKFGKYKGQPVAVMLEDRSYCEWLSAQDWFREKNVNLYQTIINYGGPPQDSPEHNEMQVRFLDPAFRLATAKALTERVDAQPNRKRIPHIIQRLEKHPHLLTSEPVAPGVGDPHFEVNGWDVVFDVESGGTRITLHETPPCTCEIGQQLGHRRGYGHDTRLEHGDSCLWYWPGFSSNEYHPFETVAGTSWVDRPTGWIATLELKPDLGDDYPSVLRQVKRQPEISRYTGWGYSCGRPAVVIRRASFARVTWDDVVAVFAASGITLLQESAIESLLGQATAD